jgi:DNA primase
MPNNIGWNAVEIEDEEEEILSIDNEIINEMIQELDLYDYFINYENIKLSPIGSNKYSAKCPFSDHQETEASFIVYEDTNSYYCFGCKRGGTIFQWLTESTGRNMHFIDAVKYVATLTGISPYADPVSALERIGEKIENELHEEEDNTLTYDEFNFIISRIGYQHIKESDFVIEEIKFTEEIYKNLDAILIEYNKYKKDSIHLKDQFIQKIKQRKRNLKNE